MRIRVKLGGDLRRYASGADGLETVESGRPLTVSEVLARFGVAEDAEEILAIVNDEVVPPGERDTLSLRDNDQLTLMPQLKGG